MLPHKLRTFQLSVASGSLMIDGLTQVPNKNAKPNGDHAGPGRSI